MRNIRKKVKASLFLALGLITRVALSAENPAYCVIDLSAGAAAASYPVTYLDAEPTGGFNTTEYKTTKLVLGRCPTEVNTLEYFPLKFYTITNDFYAGVFEVTEKQWKLVMGSNPSAYKRGDTYPVEKVSYNDIRGASQGSKWPASNAVDASSFLGKLRARTGLVFDLPTDVQWEYACRVGTMTDYNTGDSEAALAQAGWYVGNSNSQKHPVGEKVANAWGLYVMHGNVWEWCLDWCGSGYKDPVGAASGSLRHRRGGSWYDEAGDAALWHITSHDGLSPSERYGNTGFRLVLTLEKTDVSPDPDDPSLVEPKPFTVTFDANGGTASADSASYAKGETLGELPTASRDGHAFVGWFTRPSGGTQATSATKVTKSVTYYARWAEVVVPVEGSERLSATFDGLSKRTFGGLAFDADGNMSGLVQLATAKAAKDGSVSVKGFVMLEDGKRQTVKTAKGTVQDGLLTVRTTVGRIGTLDVTFGGDGFVGRLGDGTVASADVGENTGILRGTIRLSYLDAKTGTVKTRQLALTGLTDSGEAAGTLSVRGKEPQTFQAVVE